MDKVYKALAAIAVMVFGTGATAVQVPPGETATLRFEKGYDIGVKLGAATIQKYSVLKAGSCTKSKAMARLTWTNGPFKEVPVLAGKLTRFEAHTTQHRYNARGFCYSLFAFTPRPGQHYAIRQVATVGVSCRMSVIDTATGRSPNDFEHFDRAECQRRL